jgi:uncharacterized repeat protein (TIGR03803 family)
MRATSSCRARSLGLSIVVPLLAAVSLGSVRPAAAQSYTVLHAFGAQGDGSSPYAGLMQAADGNFYGTTYEGGAANLGSVFKITPVGGLTVLYSFTGTDGQNPWAGLVHGTDGNFYGTTTSGGTGNLGTVFKITPAGALTTLYSFTGGADGQNPYVALTQGADGNFYGTTVNGGAYGGGTIFKFTAAGALTTLYAFTGGADGSESFGGLVQVTDGTFYGTTINGGAGGGTVFKMTLAGALTTLYTFTGSGGTDGAASLGSLVQGTDGSFYGTTLNGGADLYGNDGARGYGTVFRITQAGSLTTLYSFTGSDGQYPEAGLVQGSDGNLYGTTYLGGTRGQGTIFKITPAGALATLHSFTNATNSDGIYPASGLVQGTDGNIYGTTLRGGPLGGGVVFGLALAAPPATAVVSGGGAICAGGSTTIQAVLTGTSPWSLTWSDGVIQSGVTVSPAVRTVSPSLTTTYTLTVFSDASGPGTASGSALVTASAIPATPTIALTSGANPACPGQTTTLDAGAGYTSYLWSTGATTRTTTVTPTATTTYSVVGTIGSCGSAPASYTLSVAACTADIGVALSGPTSVPVGHNATYTLSVTNLGPSTSVAAQLGGYLSGFQVISNPNCVAPPAPAPPGPPPAGVRSGRSTLVVAPTFTCNLPDLAAGANVQLTLTLAPISGVGNTASFNANLYPTTPDPYLANEVAFINTTVTALAPSPGQWTWMSGSNGVNQVSSYGTKNLPSATNVPGARYGSVSWTDISGNLWLFGGQGLAASGQGVLNDLWKWDGTNWTWVSGSNGLNQLGSYGTQGVASATNVPGSRQYAVSWTDFSGDLWLFGGYGYAASDVGYLNDLWRWDGTNWTWVSGSSVGNQVGSYGIQGMPGATNIPGSRGYAVSWKDSSDDLWLFGGGGYSASGQGVLNDLWKWDGANWTWVSGSNGVNQVGNYGTQGVASATNAPGSREYAVSWTDSSGNLWLFGGSGYSTGGVGSLNDLWKWTGTTWTWVNGSNGVNQVGSYGTLGVTSPTNVPGARYWAISLTDISGNLWLFGGEGFGASSSGHLNDLWKWDGTIWTWVSGSNEAGQIGSYGTQGVASATNVPGSREYAVSWMDRSGNLWLFGGVGYVVSYLNDLWVFGRPCAPIAVAPTTLPGATMGAAFSQTLTASGGTTPYTFGALAASLPPGLSLNSAGVLSGTPSSSGTFSFAVTATDANGCTGSRSYTVIISTATPPTASVFGSGTVCNGTQAKIQVNLTGTPPWSLTWTDGLTEAGVGSSPWFRVVSPTSTTTYAVTSVSNADGTGPGSGSALVTVIPCADIALSAYTAPSVIAGNQIAFTVTLDNGSGATDAPGVTVLASAPIGFTFVSNSGACTSAFPCSLGIVPARSKATIVSTFAVADPFPGPPGTSLATASFSGTSTITDPTPGNNVAQASTIVIPRGTALSAVWPLAVTTTGASQATGCQPYGALVPAPDGKLDSTTWGGPASVGNVFSFDPVSGIALSVQTFDTRGTAGTRPQIGLAPASDGKFYGVTPEGASGFGAVYRFDPPAKPALSTVHVFNGPDGWSPIGKLIQASDGLLYGTTYRGGTTDQGTIFRVDPATGTFTSLFSFSGANGRNPQSGLIQASDGFLYGTTYFGGTNDQGTVYRFDPASNAVTPLVHFTGANGRQPFIGGLMQASDGNLYGTTLYGGTNDNGTVFRVTLPAGTLTTLHSFNDTDGREPHAALIQATDGWLYGAAENGTPNQSGAVFRIHPVSLTYQLVYSFYALEGQFPRGALYQASDGSLYGTTSFGSSTNCGSVYRLVPPACTSRPTAVATGEGNICPGGGRTLGGTGGVTCSWSPVTGLSDATSCTPLASPATTTTYTLTVIGSDGCASTNNPSVTVGVQPAASLGPTSPPPASKGVPYSVQLGVMTGGDGTYTLSSPALPPGLALSPIGFLTGTPTAAGSFTFTVTASSTSSGCSTSAAVTLFVCAPVTVNPPTLAAGSSGVALSRTLTTAGGTAPYIYALASGALPTGLTLSAAGVISGTALQTGTFTFTVAATDALGCTGSRAYTWTINCPTLTLNPATFAGITIGDPITRAVSVTNAAGTVTYAVTAGLLPAGLTLTGNQISGTPTANGSYTFTLSATDAAGCTTSRAYTWTVACPVLTLAPATFADVSTGVALTRTLSLGGGPVLPVTYTATAGALPTGLSIASNLITGTPTATGTFSFTISATDAVGCTTSKAYTWNVICPTITVNPATEAAATVGVALNRPLTTSGGVAPVTLVLSGAPAWLSLSGKTLVGTPSAAGSVTFMVTATDANACTGVRTYTLAMNCPTITVTTATLARGLRETAYSKALAVSGGKSPWTFAVTVGSLPPGLNLSASGLISGTPTSGGSFPFSVVATDANGCSSAARALTLDVDWLVVNNLALGTATGGTAYNKTFTQTGGVTPMSFSISAGALPAGLTLSPSGMLAGTPTQNGTFPFTVQTVDAGGHAATRAFILSVGCFTFSPANGPLAGGTVSKPYTQTLTLNGGVGPVIFQTTAGTPPPGLSISGNKIVGTPTASGTSSFTLTATDGSGCSVSHDYSIVVGCMTINQTAVAGAIAGKAYSQTFTVTGGTAPIALSESGALPPGLVWTPPNKITGTPTAAPSSSAITVTATDAGGCTTSRPYTLSVGCFTFTPAAGVLPADATAGVPYALTFTPNGGVGTPTYALTSGTLPPGLSISGNHIVGTPDPLGVSVTPYSFTITGSDDAGCAPSRLYSLSVNCASILPVTLPAASLGTFYNQTLTVVGGVTPMLSLSGALPSGINFNSATGVLAGTPGQTGTFALTFTVTDSSGCTHSENYNLVVSCPSLTIIPAAVTITATSGIPFTTLTFTTTGGIPPVAIDIEGDLPSGMAAAGAVLSGTPTEVGLFPIVVRAIDASGCQQTKNYTIQVN